ncbi:hypothetical protein [Georgenia sp. Z1491]|uniref:hypothetical protein n=1 Tax=Georgenia sp. Z1491 TaxID=3416707 RepID=UPI003CED367C
MTMDDSPERDGARRHGRPSDDGPRPFEPVRLGRSPLHRIPTVSVLAFAVLIVIVASTTRGPVRWLMLAVVLVAALSAWRSARIRARSSRDDAADVRTTDADGNADPGTDTGPCPGRDGNRA